MRLHGPDFEFDPGTGEVHRDGTVHRLEPQPSALLALLMARRGELVTREEAIRAIWGDHTNVSFPDGLNYSIRQIRVALGDRARQPRFVETIPRRGYRLVAPAQRLPRTAQQSRRSQRRAWVAAAIAAALFVAATMVVERRPNRHHEITLAILRAVHDRLF